MMVRACACSLFLALVVCGPSQGDILDELAPTAVVCIGSDAPAVERQAARLIFRALRKRSDSALFLSDEQILTTPVSESGKRHVIAVGRPTTNSVLLTYPSYWALDRELHYAPLGHMPAAPFTETRGFYVGGFGYFFAGRNVGFVEFDRSPFYAAMLLSLTNRGNISLGEQPPLRFLIRVTGSTPNGVLLGAKRFVESRMLYGLAIGPPRWPRSHDIWNLDDENIRPDPPVWIPKGTISAQSIVGKNTFVSFLGWLMADRTMYAGFLEITGCRPAQMWRIKYQSEAGLIDFNRSPHHRASGNELLVVKLTNPDDLTRALKKLGGKMPVNIAGRTWYNTNSVYRKGNGGGFTAKKDTMEAFGMDDRSPTYILPATIAKESYLILANFGKGHMDVMIEAVARSLPEME